MPVFSIANGEALLAIRTKLTNKLSPIINVKADFLAVGDGVADDTAVCQAALDAAFGTSASPHATTNAILNRSVFFPAGTYKITSPLTVTRVHGGRIYGAGRGCTTIQNVTTNGSAFVTNGFEYSEVWGIAFQANGTGVCFDLDWDNTAGAALQSNSFFNCNFGGSAYGLRIGEAGFMGSEIEVINCYFQGCTVAGLSTRNGNALQISVIGGNFGQCDKGILVQGGSVPKIAGVGFQQSTTQDINIVNSPSGVGDGYSITGCRSESDWFLNVGQDITVLVAGCTQTSAVDNYFYYGSGRATLIGNASVNGKIGGNPYLTEFNNTWGRSDYKDAIFARYVSVLPKLILTQTGTSYSIKERDGGALVRFNNASAQTVTVGKASDNTMRLGPGSEIEIQQIGVGQVTVAAAAGVTINSSNGLKTRARYSVVRLICDGSDAWTLSGDSAV